MDEKYGLPVFNATDEDIQHIFQSTKVIAVVGLSAIMKEHKKYKIDISL
ncbi:MAG: hypothetical protein KAS92_07710 [Candidatus Omnitrophica bacterium]|nr:hypothetical protein [Candidatus Omnitrophota bacterium]